MDYTKTVSELLPFIKEVRKLHLVLRHTPQPDGRQESDAEHSWSVAFTLMVLIDAIEKEFHDLWIECEAKETLEAKIVKSVDRFDPVIHRVTTGVAWDNVELEHGTKEALDSRQLDRHAFSKLLTEVYTEIRDEGYEKKMFKDQRPPSRSDL